MSIPSLALITIWTGPLPPYLRLFLLTAEANPTVDFKFVADSPPPLDLPPNVEWVERSLPELSEGMSKRLGCDLAVHRGYKLVDFKPAFGIALGDILGGYDFWGHLDCDTVLGNIRNFATEERLAAHDILMFRGWEFVHGPLTIYRNVETVNRLFKRAPGWRDVFADEKVHSFGETCFRKRISGEPLAPAERAARGERVSMTDVVFEAAYLGMIRLYDGDHVVESNPAELPVRLRYDEGRLYDIAPVRERYENRALHVERQRSPREVLFYHLLFAKKDPLFHIPSWDILPEHFTITRAGVSTGADGPLTERAAFRWQYISQLTSKAPNRIIPELRRAAVWSLPLPAVEAIRRIKRKAGHVLPLSSSSEKNAHPAGGDSSRIAGGEVRATNDSRFVQP